MSVCVFYILTVALTDWSTCTTESPRPVIKELKKELEADEGCQYKIYLDHMGYPTAGIGHLLTDDDYEFGAPVDTPIDKERIDEWFQLDIEYCLDDCRAIFSDWDELPQEVKKITANMAFNLGRTRLSKFIAAVNVGNWNNAADEMHESQWRRQVPSRAQRLIKRMRSV